MLLCRHLILSLLPLAILSSNTTTCPYDIPYATNMISPVCYANSTAYPSATSCCWFFFAAYIYAAIRHSNLTGSAFLPPPTASARSSAFSSFLHHRLALPSLLSDSSYNLDGDPVRLATGNRPCQFPTVSLVRSSVDFLSADRLCSSAELSPDSHRSLCSQCQTAVVNSTFALLNVTNSKEFVPCGMAATIPIWSPRNTSIPRFRSFALCMLQILQNIGNLGNGDILPSPPPPSLPRLITTSVVSGARKTIKVVAGSTAAAAAAASVIAIVVFLLLFFRKR